MSTRKAADADLGLHRAERRAHMRFETTFLVVLRGRLSGSVTCVARNVSQEGLFVEARELLPLGEEVEVSVLLEGFRPEVVGWAVVRNHYNVAYSQGGRVRRLRGMGLQFVEAPAEPGVWRTRGTRVH